MSLLVDANILIDYCDTDPSVLLTYSTQIEQIVIPSVILAEVNQLDEYSCSQLNLTVVDESLGVLTEAAEARGALSFEDCVCVILCAKNGWRCATNDRRLHRECEQRRIPSIWGLRIMIELVGQQLLSREDALNIAMRMREINRFFYSEQVLLDFEASIAAY